MKYYKRKHSFRDVPIQDIWRVDKSPDNPEWLQVQLRDDGEILLLRSRRIYGIPIDAIECTEEEFQQILAQAKERIEKL